MTDLSPPAPEPAEAAAGVFAAMRSVAALTMGSRVLGFVRDVLMATALGTGLAADAFFLAWLIPNLARRLFGEGAFAAALVPVFVDAREAGEDDAAGRLVGAAVTRLALGLGLLVLAIEGLLALLRSEAGAGLFAAVGLDPAALAGADLALGLAQLLTPYLVFICIAGVLGGALNALDRFAVPAAAPVVLNVVWIGALVAGGLWLDEPLARVQALAVALVGAGVLQLLMHTKAMSRAGFPVRPRLRADPARSRRVRTLFFSLAIGLALFQLNALLDSVIAYALAPAGGVSALYYANRLVQLPIGVLGVALSTVVFPELARRAKRADAKGLGEIVDRGVRLGAFVAVPAAVGLLVLHQPLVSALFERGAFDADSSARTGRVLLFLAPAVVTACVTPVITRTFYAEEEVRLPVVVGSACVVLNLALNLLLVGPMQEAGLALATTIAQGANLVAQALLLRLRRRGRGDAPPTGETALALGRTLLLSGLMGLAAYGVYTATPGPLLLRVGLAVASGVALFTGLAWVSGAPELREVLARRRRADTR